MKTKYVIALCLLCFAVGFFAGRKTVSYKTEVRYVKGDVIRDTINFISTVKETVCDTIVLIEHDTIRTLIDWNTERFYTQNLFNDNKGSLDISATVQFNKLQNISYEFTPVYKEVTKYRVKVMQPYAGVSYNTLNYVSGSVGMFYYDIGIDLQYIRDLNENKTGYGIGINYKF